jgi:hypothetical protein
MKRSSIVAGSLAAALLVAAPAAEAASKPADAQYRGTVQNGGKFVVDVDGGKVTTVQAYFPVNCQQKSENVGGEILIDGVNLAIKKTGKGYTFKAKAANNPKAVIKGTWNGSAKKVTGTIVISPGSLKQQCSQSGGVGQNGPIPFSATRQPS